MTNQDRTKIYEAINYFKYHVGYWDSCEKCWSWYIDKQSYRISFKNFLSSPEFRSLITEAKRDGEKEVLEEFAQYFYAYLHDDSVPDKPAGIVNEIRGAIRMLKLDAYFPKESTDTTLTNDGKAELPEGLNTELAHKYFKRAAEAGYMTVEAGRYKWMGRKVQLAYFTCNVYCPTADKKRYPYPENALNDYFRVSRLCSALTQFYNSGQRQPWIAEMGRDIFFD